MRWTSRRPTGRLGGAAVDLNALREQRAALGQERFTAILADAFGQRRATEVLDLIAVLPDAGGGHLPA